MEIKVAIIFIDASKTPASEFMDTGRFGYEGAALNFINNWAKQWEIMSHERAFNSGKTFTLDTLDGIPMFTSLITQMGITGNEGDIIFMAAIDEDSISELKTIEKLKQSTGEADMLTKERFKKTPIIRDHRATAFYDFYVTGRGEFPFDMLRYDSAWPSTGEDAAKMSDCFRRDFTRKLKSVHMTSHCEPTIERWSSFGWSVGLEDMTEK